MLNTLRNFLIVFFTLVVLPLVLGEGYLRLRNYHLQFPYREDPNMGYALQENYRGPGPELYGIPRQIQIAVNALGFRGREIQEATPGLTRRVLLLGDSCTFGLGLHSEETFATISENLLNADARADLHYEVINAGVSGYTSYQGLQMLKQRGLALNPSVVAIYFGWNDHWFSDYGIPDHVNIPKMKPFVEQRLKNKQNNMLRHLRLYQKLTDVLLRLQDRSKHGTKQARPAQEVYRVPQPQFEENLREMIALSRQHNAEPILITPAHGFFKGSIPKDYLVEHFMKRDDSLIELHESYIASVRKVAEATNTRLLDLEQFFADAGRKNLMEVDGIHPNATGHRILARELVKMIQNPKMVSRVSLQE